MLVDDVVGVVVVDVAFVEIVVFVVEVDVFVEVVVFVEVAVFVDEVDVFVEVVVFVYVVLVVAIVGLEFVGIEHHFYHSTCTPMLTFC